MRAAVVKFTWGMVIDPLWQVYTDIRKSLDDNRENWKCSLSRAIVATVKKI
jgi:hypothetical protein